LWGLYRWGEELKRGAIGGKVERAEKDLNEKGMALV